MIKHRYKAKVCDVCGKTLAVKRKLFYKREQSYVTMRGYNYRGRKTVHLCGCCFLGLKDETNKHLREDDNRKGATIA